MKESKDNRTAAFAKNGLSSVIAGLSEEVRGFYQADDVPWVIG